MVIFLYVLIIEANQRGSKNPYVYKYCSYNEIRLPIVRIVM